jgi:hypothetical protein
MKNVSKKVLAYIAKHPDAKPQQVANACKAKVAYVYAIISKAKKQAQAESDLLFKASQGRAKLRGRPPMRMRTVAMFTSDKPLSRMIDTNAKDDVNHPEHYTFGGIETIDYMEAKSTKEEFTGHLRLTTLKYLSRANNKGDAIKDLKKAQWYLNKLVSTLEK